MVLWHSWIYWSVVLDRLFWDCGQMVFLFSKCKNKQIVSHPQDKRWKISSIIFCHLDQDIYLFPQASTLYGSHDLSNSHVASGYQDSHMTSMTQDALASFNPFKGLNSFLKGRAADVKNETSSVCKNITVTQTLKECIKQIEKVDFNIMKMLIMINFLLILHQWFSNSSCSSPLFKKIK